MDLKFRTLYADEIECRVDQVSAEKKGCSLLLYKDARCDMNILDETVGADNWMDDFYEAKGTLFCKIGIRVQRENGYEWIWKGDAGSPSNMEAIKGEASDARKRAGVAWSIGRELYTAPFIWINGTDIEWKKNTKGKDVPKDNFYVRDIGYDDKRRINELVICKGKGVVVYQMGKAAKKVEPKKEEPKQEEKKPVKVICPNCGRQILRLKGKDGKTYEPEEVLAQCGGVCPACYKKKKAGKS